MNPFPSLSRTRTRARVLIISRDSELVDILCSNVARLGLHTEWGSGFYPDGGMLNSLSYNGIIVDLNINQTSCLGIIHDLHANNPEIPIVVVGEKSRKYDLFFALMGGATDFLVKPIDSVLLKRKCLRLFL